MEKTVPSRYRQKWHWWDGAEIRPHILREDAGSSAINYSAEGGIAGRTALRPSAGTPGWSSPAPAGISWLLATEIRKR